MTAMVMMVGGIVFGLSLDQTRSIAASTSGMPVSHDGVDPNWQTIAGWQAQWQVPLDEESLYWVINRTGSLTGNQVVLWAAYDWSADMSTYSTRGVMRAVKTLGDDEGGTNIAGPVFSTAAMARIGGTKADPAAPLTVYFWDYEVQTTLGDLVCASGSTPIIRATSEQDDLQWSCLPTPYGTRYSAGGEADQYTGNIYMIPGGGSIDNQSSSSTGPSTEENWRFVVWDPVTGSYSLSYSVQPGDWEPGMETVPQERVKLHAAGDGSGDYDAQASYDISLDSDGNAYTYSGITPAAVGDGNMSIVRMEPARNEDGNIVDGTPDNPWRYYVVTKVAREDTSQTWSAPSSIYGNGIMNGQLILGSNTRVTASGLPTTATEGGRGTTTMVKIDAQSATASVVYSVNNTDLVTSAGYDNASSQGAEVLRGTLYQDVNGDGVISDGEPGLSNQTVALYNASGKLLSVQRTDSMGQYSFLIASVTGANMVFYIRPVEVTALLPDGVTRVNGAQTWGAGSVATGLSVNKVPLVNTAEIQCLAQGGITSSDGGPCTGAAPTTAADPPVGALGTVSDPATWHTYAKVTFNTGQYVPTADFGFTATGSFGDAPAGPLTSDVPMHANVPSTIWLGETLGSYTGPASSTSAHPSDDGVWIDSYAGKLPLEGALLASGYSYRLMAEVNGPAAAEAHVSGWVTRANTNLWDPSPRWTPSVADGVASGTFSLSTLGSIQLRVDASDKAISLPTNAGNEYYGDEEWTTAGEIEDYGLNYSAGIIRPAAVTTKGEVQAMVLGQHIAASTDVSLGEAIGVVGGEQTDLSISSLDSGWSVTGVTVKDITSGSVVSIIPITPGAEVSFPYTPYSGSDVVLEALFAPDIDLVASTLTFDKQTANVGEDITATASVVDSMGDPVPGVTVSFGNASDDIILTGENGTKSCVTKQDGTCTVTITSTVADIYPDEVSATIDGEGFTGSPQSVTFTHGDQLALSFDVTPSVDPLDENRTDWRGADGADFYQGILTVSDQYGNQVDDLLLTDIQFSVSSTDVRMSNPVNHHDGTYSVSYTSTVASAQTLASVFYQGEPVGEPKPIPFKAGDFDSSRSTFEVVPITETTCVADGNPCYTGVLTAMDEQGNPLPGLDLADIEFSASSTDVQITDVTDNGDGTYTVVYSSTTASSDTTAAVTYQGTQVGTDEPIPFAPGPFDATQSSFTVGPSADPADPDQAGWCPADGEPCYTGVLTAKDANGNPIPDLDILDIVFSASSEEVTVTSVVPTGNGTYTVRYSSRVGSSRPTARVDIGGAQIGTDQPIPFAYGAFSADESSFTVIPQVDPADPDQAGWRGADGTDYYTGIVTAKDADGTLLADLAVSSLVFSSSSPDVRITEATYTGNGTYCVRFTSTVGSSAPTAFVTYEGESVGGDEPIPYAHGPFSAAQSTFQVTPGVDPADPAQTGWKAPDGTEAYMGVLTAKDSDGHLLAGLSESDLVFASSSTDVSVSSVTYLGGGMYMVRYTSLVGSAEPTASVSYAGAQIGGDEPIPFTVEISPAPGPADLMTSRWTVTPTGPLVVGTGDANTYTATATVLDKDSNPVEGVEVSFAVTGSGPVFADRSSCQTEADGTCQVTMYSTVAGTYPVTAVIDLGALINETTSQPAAPVSWHADRACVQLAGCVPDSSVPPTHRTRTEIIRDKQTADGVAEDVVTVHVYDRWGNPVPDAIVTDPASGTVLTDQDGTAAITYTSTVAGTQPTDVTVDGSSVSNVTLTFVPGPVCTGACVPKGKGTDPDRQTRIVIVTNDSLVDEDDAVAVYAYDEYGNAVPDQEFTFVTDDPDLRFGGSDQSTITVVTDERGAGTWTVTSSKAGTHRVRVFVGGAELPDSPLELRFVAPVITEPTQSASPTQTPASASPSQTPTSAGPASTSPAVSQSSTHSTAPAHSQTSTTAPAQSQTSTTAAPHGQTSGMTPTQSPSLSSSPTKTPPTSAPTSPGSTASSTSAGPVSPTTPAVPSQTLPAPSGTADTVPPGGQLSIQTGGSADDTSRLLGLITAAMTAAIGLWAGVKVSHRQKGGGL